MKYLHDYTDIRGHTYVVVQDSINNILAFLTVDKYNEQVHPVLSHKGVPRGRKEGSGMEYLYDYMDSSGNIYVVVQDEDNNILTLTADEYNKRVHQKNIRRTTT